MGQRPSFSHLTGYPEAVASAQDFAPYGHTEQWQQLRSGGEMTALNPTGEGPGGEVTRLWRGDCLLRATRCRLRAIRWAQAASGHGAPWEQMRRDSQNFRDYVGDAVSGPNGLCKWHMWR